MIRKKFDQDLYNKYDKVTKDCIKSLLEETKYEVKESNKKTDVDLQVFKDGVYIANIEVETKNVWHGSSFPYLTVNFPQRKLKYCKLDKPTFFVMFNSDQTEYLIVKDKDLIKAPINVVSNKYVSYGEEFIQVELKRVKFGGLTEELSKITD